MCRCLEGVSRAIDAASDDVRSLRATVDARLSCRLRRPPHDRKYPASHLCSVAVAVRPDTRPPPVPLSPHEVTPPSIAARACQVTCGSRLCCLTHFLMPLVVLHPETWNNRFGWHTMCHE